jgi:hypothetical protein
LFILFTGIVTIARERFLKMDSCHGTNKVYALGWEIFLRSQLEGLGTALIAVIDLSPSFRLGAATEKAKAVRSWGNDQRVDQDVGIGIGLALALLAEVDSDVVFDPAIKTDCRLDFDMTVVGEEPSDKEVVAGVDISTGARGIRVAWTYKRYLYVFPPTSLLPNELVADDQVVHA